LSNNSDGSTGCLLLVLVLALVAVTISVAWYLVQVALYSTPVWAIGFLVAVASILAVAGTGILIAHFSGGVTRAMVPDYRNGSLVWNVEPSALPWYARQALLTWAGPVIGGAVATVALHEFFDRGAYDGFTWLLPGRAEVDPTITVVAVGIASLAAYGSLVRYYRAGDLIAWLLPRMISVTAPRSAALDECFRLLQHLRSDLVEVARQMRVEYPVDHLRPSLPTDSGFESVQALERQAADLVKTARLELKYLEKCGKVLSDLDVRYKAAKKAAIPTGDSFLLNEIKKLGGAMDVLHDLLPQRDFQGFSRFATKIRDDLDAIQAGARQYRRSGSGAVTDEMKARAILQVSPDADLVVIKAVYKALSKKYHPDKGHSCEQNMKELNWARDVLVAALGGK
jgi:hypothetical protein